MKRKPVFITLSFVVATTSAAALLFVVKKRKQDQLAAEIMRELTKLLKPSTTGLLSENALDVNYKAEVLKTTSRKILTLKNEVAIEHANTLHSAWGSWWSGDDEQTIYGVFSRLQDKVQVSQVADAYLKNFKVNLIDKLNERLDAAEIKSILDMIHPLPAFRTI